MPTITLKGLASGKTYELTYQEEEEKKTVLAFLTEKGFPMASSCRGEGVCEKCFFNKSLLGCKFRLRDLKARHIEIIEIDYL